jgi:Tol biopolymer transport system component
LGDDEPVYSPDGTKVVFIRALGPIIHSDALNDDVPSDCGLWIGDINTGKVKQITSNKECDREYNPRWSPDGSQLVYWRDPYSGGQPTGTSIYVINVDGSHERQLTKPSSFTGEADWSPDGQWIVFDSYPLAEFNFIPKNSNLYHMHPDGSGMEPLTHYKGTDPRATQPQYTPDGKWIIFTAVKPSSRSLWAIPSEGGEPVIIAFEGIHTHGTWQP